VEVLHGKTFPDLEPVFFPVYLLSDTIEVLRS